jgi:hypothetical protein
MVAKFDAGEDARFGHLDEVSVNRGPVETKLSDGRCQVRVSQRARRPAQLAEDGQAGRRAAEARATNSSAQLVALRYGRIELHETA